MSILNIHTGILVQADISYSIQQRNPRFGNNAGKRCWQSFKNYRKVTQNVEIKAVDLQQCPCPSGNDGGGTVGISSEEGIGEAGQRRWLAKKLDISGGYRVHLHKVRFQYNKCTAMVVFCTAPGSKPIGLCGVGSSTLVKHKQKALATCQTAQ